MALPRFTVFKSNYNKKYLRYIHEDVQVHGFLQFSGEEVVSQYSKIELEVAKSGSGLVHLRCCYNNKYFVRQSKTSYWIVVGADQPEEDQSKWSCTLFKPIPVNEGNPEILRLMHVQLGHYACLWRVAAPFTNCLFAASSKPDKDSCDVYTAIDWESLLILPKYVAFKGDNGKYLSGHSMSFFSYLQFASGDIGDPTVGSEIFTTNDGSVRIKSNFFGKFWRNSQNWVLADSDDTSSNNKDTLFWPIKLDSNMVALRNLGNNCFCKRFTTEGLTDCLNAGAATISKEARLEVEELVVSRQIYNVNFRLLDARIYNQRVISMANAVAVNKTQSENTYEVTLRYSDTKSSTWNSSLSLKLGVETTFKTGIPIIAEGAIEISADFEGTYAWGETLESTIEMETAYTVTVPPMTTLKVSLIATVGSCDVPFSYYQRDTLTDGTQSSRYMDDGIYTGINSYNLKYEISEQKQ